MKNILLVLLVFSICNIGIGQTVSYAYDNSGNRISRTVTVSKSLLSTHDTTNIDRERIQEQLADKTITVYPNPVREEVNVEITGYDEALAGSITLIDQSGRVIINQTSISTRNTFNLSRYSKGIYFMIIRIGTNQSKYTIIRN